jgi:hypothetical protein
VDRVGETERRIGGSGRPWYDAGKEAARIELTEDQRRQLESGQAVDVTDPHMDAYDRYDEERRKQCP